MGTQQLLFVILGVILIGIAMAVGLSLFSANAIESNQDQIVHDLNNIAQHAYQFKTRPIWLGGGGNSYSNFTIPIQLQSNENATYSIQTPGDANSITIRGTSAPGYGYIDAVLDANGEPTMDVSNFNQ